MVCWIATTFADVLASLIESQIELLPAEIIEVEHQCLFMAFGIANRYLPVAEMVVMGVAFCWFYVLFTTFRIVFRMVRG